MSVRRRRIGYRQCRIRSGNRVDVVWLPLKMPVPGRHLRLGDMPDVWVVEEVYGWRDGSDPRIGKMGYLKDFPSLAT